MDNRSPRTPAVVSHTSIPRPPTRKVLDFVQGLGPIFVAARRKGLWRKHRLCIHLLGRFDDREEEAKGLHERAGDPRRCPPSQGAIAISHLASIHDGVASVQWPTRWDGTPALGRAVEPLRSELQSRRGSP